MSEEELTQIINDENLLDQFIMGAVTSGVAQAPGLVSSTRAGNDFITPDIPTERPLINNETNDIAPVQEQTNTQETVEDIDNQIVALEEKLMATENDAEYERLSNQIKELEIRAEQIENGTVQPTVAPIQENAIQNNEIAPVQMANVEQTNQPTTQQTESNLATEVESNTQNIEKPQKN